MGSKAKAPGSLSAGTGVVRFLLRPQNRGLVSTAFVIAAAIGAAIYAWQRWGHSVAESPEYFVTAQQIEVTPQPAWIHSNVKAEALRSASISRLDLRSRQLVEQVAHAFALHPWVAKVIRVEKHYPAQVKVELQYRRPVLVVKLDLPDQKNLLFLDEQSVLLPSGDFAPSQAKDYLRIMAGGETPASIYGMPWGSERLAGAARLAAAWGDRWQPLGLYWIVAQRAASAKLVYELRTQNDQVRVIWGSSVAGESSAEPSAEQKIAALEHYVQDKGRLDRSDGSAVIDLRELAGQAAAKTAGRPEPTAHK